MYALKIFSALAVLWSLLLVGFNFIVDPIQYFRADPDPLFTKNMRYQVPGLIKQYAFDTIIVGTSHSANFRADVLDSKMGTQSLALSMNGSSGWEQNQIVAMASGIRPLKNVLWEMNYRTIAGGEGNLVSTGVFPLHLYEGGPKAALLYLYSSGTAWQGIKRLSGRGYADISSINSWQRKFSHLFDGQHVKDHYCMMKRRGARLASYIDYQSALETYVAGPVESNPETTFYLFLPPFSYFNFLLERETDRFKDFRRSLYAFVASYDNVVLIDTSSRYDWTGEAANYKDIEHFSPAISEQILDIVASESDYVEHWDTDVADASFDAFLARKISEESIYCEN